MAENPQFTSGGAITRSRFVKPDTVNGTGYAIQCTATTDKPLGIAQEGERAPPGLIDFYAGAGSDTYLAASASGQMFRTYGLGEIAQVEAGNTFAYGAFLQTDANGRAITLASGGWGMARALDAATASGQFIRCEVLQGAVAMA